ncbi:CRISPR-associated endonuclease Cas3'' [Roseateles terrae]|uniref:CRISPR-associated endonuclease/helicase Cas3 n=1 Tax=Roseateles terrae TaxID=431060 RepID=A0ABR6GWY1_9BURK|nr:CRISPR-associated endonuclease Cas3'' [Roseateles terrae]MBB3196622.1 CRISPR-associated endonuclease/helicase Cas3 [Roseateles terrae]OWQ84876.1 CRISPR-associated endonuclease Cas3'' [Roseateles terrae]
MIFFGHSATGLDESDWQRLSEHLQQVAVLAGKFADAFGAAELGHCAGLLHDLGKYTDAFQRRLRGSAEKVDHSTWGARIALARYPTLGYLLAYGIAGHHAGLANGKGDGRRTSLQERLNAVLPALDERWAAELSAPAEVPMLRGFRVQPDRGMFQMAFLVRMLFSCLVDADYLDTEAFYQRVEQRLALQPARPSGPALGELQTALDAHLSAFRATTAVNTIRAEILQAVRDQAGLSPGIFSLTVPTGGGKTLASLAFALDHAIRHGQQRVIFVIPFTSIVEQNAAVFRRALGRWGDAAVLEHHSAFADDPTQGREARDKLRLSMENWDRPVIVTTAVQFFESLFADRPSQCRKLHNIANSVVVLDEAQTMPLHVLRPCVAALDELSRNYRSSVVLCTATQPALRRPDATTGVDGFDGGLENVRELAPEPAALFQRLKRVTVKRIGSQDDAQLLGQLREQHQVLCIVNNRRHARSLFQGLQDLAGTYHLTTLMCAAHRSEVLAAVRAALTQGRPCRLVATALIEAGVDISFPIVYRAEAGLDSIAQAAGRCNREGLRAVDDSELRIFATANDAWAPPPELRQFADVTRDVLRNSQGDPLDPATIEKYFKSLYWARGDDALDRHDLLGTLEGARIDSLPMETLAEKFRMIETAQRSVIIPFKEEGRSAVRDLHFVSGLADISRRLQRYLVQVPLYGFEALRKAGAIEAVRPKEFGDQFFVLVNESLYGEHVGLSWEAPTFISVQSLVQ